MFRRISGIYHLPPAGTDMHGINIALGDTRLHSFGGRMQSRAMARTAAESPFIRAACTKKPNGKNESAEPDYASSTTNHLYL